MMNTKHTPGPWELEEAGSVDIVGGSERELLSTAYPMYHDGLVDSYKANARLIAAAPAMLEALEACLGCLQMECDECSGCTTDPCTQCRAKAAIRLAVGETDQEQARVIGNGMHRSRQGELG